MSTEILLVRHGQTKSNSTGYYMGWSSEDLSEEGIAQVQSLSARLSSLPIAAIYASPLQRTVTTADMIAKPHNLEVKPVQD
jgi:broad specificity phosphatase PhoE